MQRKQIGPRLWSEDYDLPPVYWEPGPGKDPLQAALDRVKNGRAVFPEPLTDPRADLAAMLQEIRDSEPQPEESDWVQRYGVAENADLGKTEDFFKRLEKKEYPIPELESQFVSPRPPRSPPPPREPRRRLPPPSGVPESSQRPTTTECNMLMSSRVRRVTAKPFEINDGPPNISIQLFDSGGDGNCMFNSIAASLNSACYHYSSLRGDEEVCHGRYNFSGAGLRQDLVRYVGDATKRLDKVHIDGLIGGLLSNHRSFNPNWASDRAILAAEYESSSVFGTSEVARILTKIYPGLSIAIFTEKFPTPDMTRTFLGAQNALTSAEEKHIPFVIDHLVDKLGALIADPTTTESARASYNDQAAVFLELKEDKQLWDTMIGNMKAGRRYFDFISGRPTRQQQAISDVLQIIYNDRTSGIPTYLRVKKVFLNEIVGPDGRMDTPTEVDNIFSPAAKCTIMVYHLSLHFQSMAIVSSVGGEDACFLFTNNDPNNREYMMIKWFLDGFGIRGWPEAGGPRATPSSPTSLGASRTSEREEEGGARPAKRAATSPDQPSQPVM